MTILMGIYKNTLKIIYITTMTQINKMSTSVMKYPLLMKILYELDTSTSTVFRNLTTIQKTSSYLNQYQT